LSYGKTAFAQMKNDTIDVDLYFRYFDFFRYFEMQPKKLKNLEHMMLSANLKKSKDSTYIVLFRKAIKDKLISSPFIYVKTDTADFRLFLTQADYCKFIIYDHDSLEKEHKKIRIKSEVQEICYFGGKAYQCVNLISIHKTDGDTYDNKSNSYPNHYLEPINDSIK
jgi:hypothetical protein